MNVKECKLCNGGMLVFGTGELQYICWDHFHELDPKFKIIETTNEPGEPGVVVRCELPEIHTGGEEIDLSEYLGKKEDS